MDGAQHGISKTGQAASEKKSARAKSSATIVHPIPPVWDSESRTLLLGTMPSPASRNAGFFYMHPQNRFWRIVPAVFGEALVYTNKGLLATRSSSGTDSAPSSTNNAPPPNVCSPQETAASLAAAIAERHDFLLRHHIALWDVLSQCDIHGAADATIRNAVANDFTAIFEQSKIRRVFCTGKSAYALWQKHCAARYESSFALTSHCLPSTSPANAAWSAERLIEAYSVLKEDS